jgi:Alginate lyase
MSNRSVVSEGRFVARHSLPRGRHVRYALPQPVTRHAAEVDAFAVAGSVPVRRGIAVVAVVGGALSAGSAMAPTPQPPEPADADPAAISLAANTKHSGATGKNSAADPVLDSAAVKDTVRKANEEGRRLAAENRRSRDGAAQAGASRTSAQPAVAAGTASMPGELIDTHEWYLTLPTGKNGSPDTVDGSKLATYHSKFFDLNQQRNGIVFNAGADGVTTKNSHYPRSELREMDGSAKAAWSNTSGTHVFDVCEAFTKLPAKKPEVVGVQIHDGKDDVMQIRLEGQKLMVQYHDGKSNAVLDPGYKLGTPFDVRIVAAGGKVDVLYNGQKKAELPLSGSGWYWKVGAYVQSNGSKGDGASSTGEVVVYKADVKHS